MSDPATRTALCVTLISDSPAARKLLVAWPAVDRSLRGRALYAAWGRAAGVAPSVVARVGHLLVVNRLVVDDGSLDPEAAKVIATLAAQALGVPRRASR